MEVKLKETLNTIELNIRDSGPGIPESEHENVFERFVRLENAYNTSGNGLGLSFVKAACTLHNATIALSNGEPGLIISICFVKNQEPQTIAFNPLSKWEQ